MSESVKHIVREIYSEVMFELAEEAGMIDDVMEDLSCVEKVLRAQPDFASLLSLQTMKGREKSDIVRRVFSGKINDLTLDFLSVLARRNRLNFLGGITDRYESLVDVYNKRSLIEVTLASAPNDGILERLKSSLSSAINAKVKLTVNVDPLMIGGIVIKKGDRLIDNSVRTVLQKAVETIMERSKVRLRGVDLS